MNKEKFLNWIKANKKGVGIIGVALAVIILIGGGYSIYRYTNKPLQVAENKESDTLLKQEETAEGTSDKADENIDGKKDNEESGQVDSQENKSEDKTNNNTTENSQENNNEKTDEKSNNGNGVASAGNSSSSKGNNQASSNTGGNGSNKQTGKPSGTSSSSSNGGQSKPNISSSSKPSGNGNTSTSKPSKPNKPSKPSGNVNKPNTNNKPSKPVEKPSKPQRTWQYMSSLSQQTFNALNNYRTSHGVKALKHSSSCASGAKSQAESNAKNRNAGHGYYQISYVGGGSSASSYINAWANSAGHKKNMLDKDMVEGGVAVYKDSDGVYYVVAQFGDDW
ncbi:CAP domain-containing protein [Clostridium sardiniense]|uniref:CAP domain-containing protein n=1 Tax=Clostridium sardiniense TaxID=29369 RepID=UPI00195706E7|nr:CAP domain-containing protein [Clostridium sardiniense]MBM7835623.1 uncharacterized protein YkwD [Clostridium sardiniense]